MEEVTKIFHSVSERVSLGDVFLRFVFEFVCFFLFLFTLLSH